VAQDSLIAVLLSCFHAADEPYESTSESQVLRLAPAGSGSRDLLLKSHRITELGSSGTPYGSHDDHASGRLRPAVRRKEPLAPVTFG
jgi:hypothetical protein